MAITTWLSSSKSIDARFANKPIRKTRLMPQLRVRRAPSSHAPMAVTAWGKNIAP